MEYLHDAVLPAAFESAQCHRGRLVREDFLVRRCGRAVVDENRVTARCERAATVVQKWGSRAGGTWASQKAKSTASWRLPLEQVGLDELDRGGLGARTSEGQRFGCRVDSRHCLRPRGEPRGPPTGSARQLQHIPGNREVIDDGQ
ncbi:hypothetical protein BIV23_39450 [Streptomyces monashensis]|uniref:Uncharacterized protein n=1 Tax=Streptomyces monashensis TaxID=1678012 RepID=A0A1S2PDY1_9ACTN|nr:hypothetical protein BIV23_39450 [Streptomyces monashensis]